MNILFTCAGRREYLLRYFKEQLGDSGKIIGCDMQLSAPALTAADIAITVPSVYDEAYIPALVSICKEYKVTAIISLNDLELPILSEVREKFLEMGVTIIVSSPEVIDICFDKYKTANYIKSLGLNTPKTYLGLAEAKSAIENGELTFPLVIKPRWGSGSIGIEFVDNLAELEMVYKLLQHKVAKSILGKISSTSDNYLLIQKKICGSEYGLDIMNDLNGNHIAVSVKQKLGMRSGETDKAITVDNPEIRSIGSKLGQSLKHIGNLDVDVLEQKGCFYVLELNPRFGGGFPFSYEAGVNLPGAIIAWLKGEKVAIESLIPKYGCMFAKCDHLVRIYQ